jgi:Kef-type K+ transport system membrane component KefB
VALAALDIDLTIVLGAAIVTALVAYRTALPITALEIVAGIVIVTLLGISLPAGTTDLVIIGSLLIVFLAGLETGMAYIRAHAKQAFAIGLPAFLIPFLGLFALLFWGAHAPFLVSVIGATALADTSISVVYTTLHQFELTELPFGRLLLAATLVVNLFEDTSITVTTFLTGPGVLFTLVVLIVLLVAAIYLPRLARAASEKATGTFANIGARTLLFSLSVLSVLSALVGVPGILFVFLMGLIFAEYADRTLVSDTRKFAFALFVPIYFIAVGLRVDLGEVLSHWPLLVGLILAATLLKIGATYPIALKVFRPGRAGPVAVILNARLTSATVILLLTLTIGLIPISWYSILISAVVLLALGSSLALRAFPMFHSVEAAKAAFAGDLQPPVAPVRSP